ncbi:hypothetical protein J3L18_03935 [Mucilaginibacter gossypii]|uniref:hypothetical protein n=1 Tax=Mucilaginibacter gossypii TaxID=551996 RepID=UPI000DCE327B|nr:MULTISPECIES: hypothetical protein [Mucilaginibacter]QTE38233.1 hypothetical protein J3L18_03935 [Mucilaginibacter gossypii]RAV60294.1 hypothetical protein DIU36_01370 [Mucilaginibacter rubeus]
MVVLFCQRVLAIGPAGLKKLKKTQKKPKINVRPLSVDFILHKVLVVDNQIFIGVSGKILKL